MIRLRPFAAAAAIVALLAGGLTFAAPDAAQAAPRDDVVSLTNANRANAGLPALQRQSSLDAMAQEWANSMASKKSMVHSTNAWRTARATAGWTLCCGENIAYGYTTASSVVSAWVNSPGHRANMLDSRYTHMGAGYNASGHYWVQVFATYPKAAAVTGSTPTISGTAAVGNTLTVSATSWAPSGTTLAYRWKADGAAISGATGTSLKLTTAHAGRRISVAVTGTASGYSSTTKTSAATAMVKTSYSVDRIQGSGRYSSAVEISQSTYSGTVGTVVVASGENFPDAVGAAPAAAHLGAPLLLTRAGELPSVVATEIRRLDPDRIIIVGGTAAIGTGVEASLGTIAPTQRIAGASRFVVSAELARSVFRSSGSDVAYVATGSSFVDAVSAGSAAAADSAPILLARSGAAADDRMIETLRSLGVSTVKVAGGTSVVSDAYVRSLRAAGFTVERLGGANRFLANQTINAQAFSYESSILLASGMDYPDALAGATLAASRGIPLYITRTTCVDPGIIKAMTSLGASKVTLLGGTASLSTGVGAMRTC